MTRSSALDKLSSTSPTASPVGPRGPRERALAIFGGCLRVFVYIDGFNLYYRALRNTAHRWLDLGALASLLLTGHTVVQIRYFTARVQASRDPQSPLRQQAYLRALGTITHLSIHFGTFQHTKPWERLVTPFPPSALMPEGAPTIKIDEDGEQRIRVHRTNEKGSDVNLASYLLLDGLRGQYEGAAVITNDSDLVTPIKMVRDELGLPVEVLDPNHARGESRELKQAATFYRKIRPGSLAASQFPSVLPMAKGRISKPRAWWRETQRSISIDLLVRVGALDRCPVHRDQVYIASGDVEDANELGCAELRLSLHGDAFESEAELRQYLETTWRSSSNRCAVCPAEPDHSAVQRLMTSW